METQEKTEANLEEDYNRLLQVNLLLNDTNATLRKNLDICEEINEIRQNRIEMYKESLKIKQEFIDDLFKDIKAQKEEITNLKLRIFDMKWLGFVILFVTIMLTVTITHYLTINY